MKPQLRTALNVLAALALVAGLASSCAAFMHSQRIGGSVTNGVFYPNHGIAPAQSPSAEDLAYSARFTNLLCLTIPLMVLAFFCIFTTEITPRFF